MSEQLGNIAVAQVEKPIQLSFPRNYFRGKGREDSLHRRRVGKQQKENLCKV